MWKKTGLLLVLVMCQYLMALTWCARVKRFCFPHFSVEGNEAPHSQECSQSWNACWQSQQKARLERDCGVSCGVGCAPFRYGVRHCMDWCTIAAQLNKGLFSLAFAHLLFWSAHEVLNQTKQASDCSYKMICWTVPFRDGMRRTIFKSK